MFKNQKGFSLVQIMIAGTVMAMMSAGIANMIVQQSKTISYMEDRMSHQNYKKEIEQVLADNAICEESLRLISLPAVGAGVNVGVVKDPDGNVLFSTDDPAKSTFDQIKIDSIRVGNISVPTPDSSGQIKLIFNIKRLRAGGGGESLKPVEVTRDVDVDATSRVIACRGGDDDLGGLSSCLENQGGQSTDSGGGLFGSSGVFDVAYRVPANVKALRIVTNSDSVSKGGDNDCSNSTPSVNGMFLLNGKSQLGGVKMEAGKTLRFVKESGQRAVRIYYNNALVASGAMCGTMFGGCDCSPGSLRLNQPVMTCSKDGDYDQDPTSNKISVSYWK